MRVWDLVLKSEIHTIKSGHTSTIACITFSNDKKTMITGGRDGKILLWNT